MTAAKRFPKARAFLCGSAVAVLLAACAEEEIILQGEREDIRPDAVREVVNEARPISLPQQTANAAWPQGHGAEASRTAHPALAAAVQRIWTTSIGAGDSRRQRITATPVAGGGRIFTLDSGARVSAVSPQGALLWQRELIPPADEEGQATGGGLAYDGGVVYVSSGYGVLTALNAESGQVIWRQELDATGSGQPRVSGDLVYLVAGDDTGWAVNTKTGRIAWQVDAVPSDANILGAPAPVVTRDLAIFAFGSGDLIATFRQGGLRRWSASVAGKRTGFTLARISDVTGAPVVDGGRLYAGNHAGRTVAFDLENGERLWTAREGAAGTAWPAGGSLFQVSDQSQLLRLDAATGEVIWAVDLPGFVKDKPGKRGKIYTHYGPVLAGGQLVLASGDGLLRFFDPVSGRLMRTAELPGGAGTAPVVAGRTLYVVSSDGELHAYR
ncbi:PQQ-binding-like beta-propeller repeat protein [Cribrihabitans pelagius]|uniref:PQQ-like beta-propeller repeat protein n=1 Tax=Cribrihabitans pelagius TaxID=1765746 RepID=UPI003B5CA017